MTESVTPKLRFKDDVAFLESARLSRDDLGVDPSLSLDLVALKASLLSEIAAQALPSIDPADAVVRRAVRKASITALSVGLATGLIVGGVIGMRLEQGRSASPPAITSAQQRLDLSSPSPPALLAVVDAPHGPAPAPIPPIEPSMPAVERSPRQPALPVARAQASTLAAELELLDRAEAARRVGNLDVANRELEAYRERFPSGTLTLEADLALLSLRVEQGRDDEVISLSHRLIADPRVTARMMANIERLAAEAKGRGGERHPPNAPDLPPPD